MPTRNKAALLALTLGAIGAHRFYLGQRRAGCGYLALFFFAPFVALFCGWLDAAWLFWKADGSGDWLSWKPRVRRRLYFYGGLALILGGSPLFPAFNRLLLPSAPPHTTGQDAFRDFALAEGKLPIFYRDEYNIRFFGLEKLHPFDSEKYGRVLEALVQDRAITRGEVTEPPWLPDEGLSEVHGAAYLKSLESPLVLTLILEIPIVLVLPWALTHRQVLRPMRFATSGTILSAQAALKTGWAINLGGGFHHASADSGGGFCVFADLTLAVHFLRATLGRPAKVLILDLDAHQGNGHERDFAGDPNTFIVDLYNPKIYPEDAEAKAAIGVEVKVLPGTTDTPYLASLSSALDEAATRFTPELVLYNAGTDTMAGDPLGKIKLTPEGIVRRDQRVFEWALGHHFPIAMVLSGGYQKTNAPVIARSIGHLLRTVIPPLRPRR